MRVWRRLSGAALLEGEALQVFGAEGVDGCGLNVGKGNADFDPASGGHVTGVFAEVDGSG